MAIRNVLAVVCILLLSVLSAWRLRMYDANAESKEIRKEQRKVTMAYMAETYFHPSVKKGLTATITETEVLEKLKHYKSVLATSLVRATFSEPYDYGNVYSGGQYIIETSPYEVRYLPFWPEKPTPIRPGDRAILEALLQCHIKDCYVVKDSTFLALLRTGDKYSPVSALYNLKPDKATDVLLDVWFVYTRDTEVMDHLIIERATPLSDGWWKLERTEESSSFIYSITRRRNSVKKDVHPSEVEE